MQGIRLLKACRPILAGIIALFAAHAAAADVQYYRCAMNLGPASGYWVAPEIVFGFAPGSETIEIMDGWIAKFNNGQAVRGTVSSNTDKSLAFKWSIFTQDSAGHRTKMQYIATYFRAKKSLHVEARPAGYIDKYSADGTCKPA